MKNLIFALLILYPVNILGSDARFANGVLEIDEVDVTFPPGVVHNAKLGLAKDGRWDLLEYVEGKKTDRAIYFGYEEGPCVAGYCSFPQLVITPESATIYHKRSITTDDIPAISPSHIDLEMQSLDQDLWKSVINLEEFKSFAALPDEIGNCLGCADSPVAYIAVQLEGQFKRIRFEPQDGPGQLYRRLLEIYNAQNTNLSLAIKKLGY